MRTIRPLSAQDCIKLINDHRTEIQNGEIEFQIEGGWLSYFDESLLIFFAQYGNWRNKRRLLEYHRLPTKVLELLAKDNDKDIRQEVASLSITPKNILQSLSTDQDPEVRGEIARNRNTPSEILIMLANDTSGLDNTDNTIGYISEILVKFLPEIGVGIFRKYLQSLEDSPHKISIRQTVMGNPNMPPNMLREFSTDADTLTRVLIAVNPSTPIDVLELLARDGSSDVRRYVISNPNTPISIIRLLKDDSDVRWEVEKVLNKPNNQNSCFIATEVYCSSLDVNVLTLKKFRDDTLMTSYWGKLFVTYYYQISPSIAYLLSKNRLLRMIIKYGVLNPLVWIIQLIKHRTK